MNAFLDYLLTAIPLGMTFLYGCTGEILTEKAGHLNLGIPGIMCIGGDTAASSELITQGPFVMNTRNHTLEKGGNRIRLTQVEYAILKLFMQNPGRALSREDILTAVWGRDYDGELKIVDVNIRRLRIKIEDDTANPTFITTVWGLGYKWGA